MPKLSQLRTAEHVHGEALRDPEVRTEYDRAALAHQVALSLIRYRTEHGLSQTALARKLGMHQSAVARLEAGDHEPSLATLARLARGLRVEFHIDITPETFRLQQTA